jgi:uncharacterized protein YggU (UPF0235/DUF167 family)
MTGGDGSFFRLHEKGADVFVRLTPKSSTDRIGPVEQLSDGKAYLTTRVRAVPDKGAANAALEKLLASELGLPRGDVKIVSGSTSRLKTVRLDGVPGKLRAVLEAIAAQGKP